MVKFPSFSTIACGVVFGYIFYSLWSLSQVFLSPSCLDPNKCLKSYLSDSPSLDLYIFSSPKVEPNAEDVKLVDHLYNISYFETWEKKIALDIPKKVQDNGSFHLHLFAVASSKTSHSKKWSDLLQHRESVYVRIPVTQLHVPDSFIFNLLDDDVSTKKENEKKKEKLKNINRPVTHLRTKVAFNMLTDPLYLPKENIPPEIHYRLRMSQQKSFLPILIYNFLETKLEDLKLMKNDTEEITLKYSPINMGKLRFVLHLESAVVSLKKMGFSAKDVDDVKSIFAGTNLYLLSITVVIISFHILFDFLAFKNDVKFWSQKSTMEGLSSRTVMWRAFSQAVVFLYLLDEKASVIVLAPSGIATIIECWKVVKMLRRRNSADSSESEKKTDEYDAESMRYLSYILYPLCIGGAVYSLIYQPHKSWYSWCIHSLVNGVYAFGFLFMLPQLFVNYRLKSVAALPWRAFMYKAFNTFIDDVFAFIITMPAAHRVACFRDDVIFLVYLYQRWLYPVDKSRLDETARALGEKEEKSPETKKTK